MDAQADEVQDRDDSDYSYTMKDCAFGEMLPNYKFLNSLWVIPDIRQASSCDNSVKNRI